MRTLTSTVPFVWHGLPSDSFVSVSLRSVSLGKWNILKGAVPNHPIWNCAHPLPGNSMSLPGFIFPSQPVSLSYSVTGLLILFLLCKPSLNVSHMGTWLSPITVLIICCVLYLFIEYELLVGSMVVWWKNCGFEVQIPFCHLLVDLWNSNLRSLSLFPHVW